MLSEEHATLLCQLAGELECLPPRRYNQDSWSNSSEDCPVCASVWAVRWELDGFEKGVTRLWEAERQFGLKDDEREYIFSTIVFIKEIIHRKKWPEFDWTPQGAAQRIDFILDLNGWERVYEKRS